MEAHHILEQKLDDKDVESRVIYSDRIRNAAAELKSIMKQGTTCNLNKIVAELVDHRFALRLGIRSQVAIYSEKTSVVRNVQLAVKLLYRDVLAISTWPRLLRLFVDNYKVSSNLSLSKLYREYGENAKELLKFILGLLGIK